MFHVSSELYDEIAIRLREAFGGGGFYSGSVECAVGETSPPRRLEVGMWRRR